MKAVRYWNAEAIRKVPASAPLEFVPQKWKAYVYPTDGVIDRQYYEICLTLQLHQALKSGEIWAAGGRRYGNVDDLLIGKDTWSRIPRPQVESGEGRGMKGKNQTNKIKTLLVVSGPKVESASPTSFSGSGAFGNLLKKAAPGEPPRSDFDARAMAV